MQNVIKGWVISGIRYVVAMFGATEAVNAATIEQVAVGVAMIVAAVGWSFIERYLTLKA